MIDLYQQNGLKFGKVYEADERITKKLGGSSDMGDVSYEVPAVHPEFVIGCEHNSHTQEFTPASGNSHRIGP